MSLFPSPGDPLEPEALTLDRARQVRDALALYPFASLIEARRRATENRYEELLVVEIEVDLPQDTVYDIRAPEQLVLGFERDDRDYPTVDALRTDFPAVPHLYWTPAGEPRSLCLYEAPWAEVRLRWTGAGFLGDIARWLALTAVGELHDADQPLEPFLFGPRYIVVIPDGLFEGDTKRKAYVAAAVDEREGKSAVVKLLAVGEDELPETPCMHVVTAVGELAVQDAMHDCPRNMMELIELLRLGGIDLVSAMVEQLGLLFEGGREPREEDGLLLLVKLLRRRRPAGATEALEAWAFAIWPIRDAAIATGHSPIPAAEAPWAGSWNRSSMRPRRAMSRSRLYEPWEPLIGPPRNFIAALILDRRTRLSSSSVPERWDPSCTTTCPEWDGVVGRSLTRTPFCPTTWSAIVSASGPWVFPRPLH